MKFGTFFAYWEHAWQGDYMEYAKRIRDIGFDVMEVSAGMLLDLSDEKLRALKAYCADIGLSISSNLGPAKEHDISSVDPAVRRAGIENLQAILRKMDVLDSRTLIGVLYAYWPCDFTDVDRPGNWARSVESMREVGRFAQDYGVDLCQEVVNRYEHFLLNTAEQAVAYVRDVDLPNVLILLDTFHMNIEEDNLPDAFRTAGKLLGHVHVGEGNRKVPGQGHLPWAEMGQALRDIGYDRYVVMEPFVLEGGQVGQDIKVWRDLSGGATQAQMDDAIRASLQFLKKEFLG